MTLLVGEVDWLKLSKKVAENGGDPFALYRQPMARVYAVYMLEAGGASTMPARTPKEMRAVRNKERKRKGLPLIPDPKGE